MLVLEGGVSGVPGGHDGWSREDIVLERPDGITVAGSYSSFIGSDPQDVTVLLEVVQPVSGTYSVTVYGEDGKSATHEIVVP